MQHNIGLLCPTLMPHLGTGLPTHPQAMPAAQDTQFKLQDTDQLTQPLSCWFPGSNHSLGISYHRGFEPAEYMYRSRLSRRCSLASSRLPATHRAYASNRSFAKHPSRKLTYLYVLHSNNSELVQQRHARSQCGGCFRVETHSNSSDEATRSFSHVSQAHGQPRPHCPRKPAGPAD